MRLTNPQASSSISRIELKLTLTLSLSFALLVLALVRPPTSPTSPTSPTTRYPNSVPDGIPWTCNDGRWTMDDGRLRWTMDEANLPLSAGQPVNHVECELDGDPLGLTNPPAVRCLGSCTYRRSTRETRETREARGRQDAEAEWNATLINLRWSSPKDLHRRRPVTSFNAER